MVDHAGEGHHRLGELGDGVDGQEDREARDGSRYAHLPATNS